LLLPTIKDTINKIEERKLVCFRSFDVSKAFNTVDHQILLHKLQYYGFLKETLDFIKSYLEERTQYVNFNDENSTGTRVEIGVPQGPCLRPLFF
jgi:hypothetical protein